MVDTDIPFDLAFSPIADNGVKTLILGSMPGVKSLEHQQYYAHPRNAFWPIMQKLFGLDEQLNYSQRCQQLLSHHIAVWDVLQSCQRPGSLDQHIVNESAVSNNFELFFKQHPTIEKLCFNGAKAEQLYIKHVVPTLTEQYQLIDRIKLPSTSPAHASMNLSQKYEIWQQALIY